MFRLVAERRAAVLGVLSGALVMILGRLVVASAALLGNTVLFLRSATVLVLPTEPSFVVDAAEIGLVDRTTGFDDVVLVVVSLIVLAAVALLAKLV